jgi:3-deoxy-D-manno-octulosonic-acid transferase
MIFFYNSALFLFHSVLKIAALFNPKAKQWVKGRKDIFNKMETALNSKPKTLHKESFGQNAKRIWIHVASLGEFEQGKPIIEQLKRLRNTDDSSVLQEPLIILTFFSPSGYEIRKNYPLADHVFYLPLDTAENAQRFLDLVKPDIAIFIKYEFWFHYLNTLKKKNIPTLLVSGIFRDKQFSKGHPYTYFLKKMFGCFTHFFVQTPASLILLKKLGFDNVTLAGDTRIDRVAKLPEEGRTFPLIENFIGDASVFIGGSTWQADETAILPLLENEHFKNWKFIFAPHDISESNIKRLEKSLPIASIRYSELEKSPITHYPLLIIDNVGMLSALYRYGRIAYIGGGFGKGIHNTLEPIAFGLPVIFGPKYQKFEEAIQLMGTGGGFSIANQKEFLDKMIFLKENAPYLAASDAAKNYVFENRGATEKVIDYINSQLMHGY